MVNDALQSSLFEEDYLLRELGAVAHDPQVALTELVANAWDAGATHVDLVLPSGQYDFLTVTDDGHGMTPEQFRKRWMTLRYDRLKHQGESVEFPVGRDKRPRRAFGRNGVGRHGLLCFANEYEVKTWRDGALATYVVGTQAGSSPFVIRREIAEGKKEGSGTALSVQVLKNLPDVHEILTVLATRFIHDPEFEIRVNGQKLAFDELAGKVREDSLDLGDGRRATVSVIDSTRANQSSIHQGIAFWVQRRLVGFPSWSVGSVTCVDGRTSFARRYKVIVDTDGYEGEVNQDWTAFRNTDAVRELFKVVTEHIGRVARDLAMEVVEATSADALLHNISELEKLGKGAQQEVAEFTKAVARDQPTISPDFLATAVKAVINLEKTKSGAALLQKLSALPADDVCSLDRLLEEWSVKDALSVLDAIDGRIKEIEAIRKLAGDPDADELHTLHPLILRSRWIFGPEFESSEYCSNETLRTIARDLFESKGARFINERRRPDIVVLPDRSTWQMLGIESFNHNSPEISQIKDVLIIELKKGGFKITRDELYQADGYMQDIHGSGAMVVKPFISAWVVGHSIAPGVETDKKLGDPVYGRLRATTFNALVDTADRRMMRLRSLLKDRYGDLETDALLKRVLAHKDQGELKF